MRKLIGVANAEAHQWQKPDYGVVRKAYRLPASRQDAKPQRISYEYDKMICLSALVNKNNAAYRFA